MGKTIFAAMDTETTGLNSEIHEIIDLAIVPLNDDFSFSEIPELHIRIKAEHLETAEPEALQVSGLNPNEGLSLEQAKIEFQNWLKDNDIERIYPLGHNLAFDLDFINKTFPEESKIISFRGRDSMYLARVINDVCRREKGVELFPKTSLSSVRSVLGITGEQTHHALDDARDSAIAYREMLNKLMCN